MPRGATPESARETMRCRVRALLRACGEKTQRRVATAAGLSTSTVSGWMRDGIAPNREAVRKLAGAYPDVDVEGILYPEDSAGESHRPSGETAVNRTAMSDGDLVRELEARLAERAQTPPDIRWVGDRHEVESREGSNAYQAVPFAEDAAAAGPGRMMSEDIGGYVLIHGSVMGRARGEVVCVRVNGASMEGTLPDHSIVAFDLGRRDPREADGRIVLARIDDGNVIKRWRATPSHVLLYSDTPNQKTYPPIVLEADAVDEGALLGVAFWAWVDLS